MGRDKSTFFVERHSQRTIACADLQYRKFPLVFATGQKLYRESSPVPSFMLIIMTRVVIAETAKIHKIKPAE
jgi:hypothetical protein